MASDRAGRDMPHPVMAVAGSARYVNDDVDLVGDDVVDS